MAGVRRFLRILLGGVTVFSFLLCLSTVVLWVRSYWVGEFVGYNQGPSGVSYWVRAEADGISFEKFRFESSTRDRSGWTRFSIRRGTPMAYPGNPGYDPAERGIWSMPRVDTTSRPSSPAFNSDGLWASAHLPFWVLAAVTGIAPTIRLCRSMLRRRRTSAGLCSACGYDLRATPDRCPECGATPTATKETAAQQPGTAAPQKT
jgi:hypothetical protein